MNLKLPWPPTVNHYYRMVNGRMLLSKKGREYKKTGVLMLLEQKAKRPLEGRIEVRIDAYPPDKRVRDIDNLVKPIFDTLQEYGMFNDSQIDDLRIRRLPVAVKPGFVRVFVAEIER